MTTVDQAVEAGAESACKFVPTSLALLTPAFRVGLASAWPILSAPLREMHKPTRVGSRMRCFECATTHYPCPTMITIYETDKELGL